MSRLVGRKVAELSQPELGVAGSCFAAKARPLVETREEHAQHGSLNLVEA